ncbi:sugar transferase [Clostridium cellulovorans]|uniref:Undecaprenyl-phosphate galactose phosphotransferase n=1 Tax=Clostridium cellulovorans (strain ATCC 35296 / DSM 3052 / OCM 3 / 743B) TaxID=573061 RepID=D9ST50_CLOC7|nr:sugar transferase [Clostridium cellulovorans]ADL50666.1 Undecaprenyl-phosphate galactose phosphotransferase [Clostridium cellulovorans 743B]
MNNAKMEISSTVEAVEVRLLALKRNEKLLYEKMKRFLDIFLSLIGCVIGIPIVIITCIVVVLESKGNPIYTQERLGKDGQAFKLYKIRSMCTDAEKNGPKWADKNDSRVTRVGKFIRKTRIDEIPQLFNILKGDMSIVGPRPERSVFTFEFQKEIPTFINRLQVKPGLTGLAQVNGGYDITPKEKLKHDLEYIENRNFSMDFKIILKTALIVFNHKGAR